SVRRRGPHSEPEVRRGLFGPSLSRRLSALRQLCEMESRTSSVRLYYAHFFVNAKLARVCVDYFGIGRLAFFREIRMSFTLHDMGSENYTFGANVWNWKAALEVIKSLDVISEGT